MVMLDEHLITYLTAAQVRKRYGGGSHMGVWGWVRGGKLGFPQPLRVQSPRGWTASSWVAGGGAPSPDSPAVDLQPRAEPAAGSWRERAEQSTPHAEAQLNLPCGAGTALASTTSRPA